MNRTFRLVGLPEFRAWLAHVPPIPKARIRAALRYVEASPHSGEPLKRELKRFHKYVVDKYRIVYRIDEERSEIYLVMMDRREVVYDRVRDRLGLRVSERKAAYGVKRRRRSIKKKVISTRI